MQKLYSAGTLQEAYLVLHRLEHAGIEARVLNQYAQGGLGDLPFTHAYPEVWLLEPADAERARAVVAEYEAAGRTSVPHRCRFCNEESPASFELCWRCGAALGS
jgi:hypothetical protein